MTAEEIQFKEVEYLCRQLKYADAAWREAEKNPFSEAGDIDDALRDVEEAVAEARRLGYDVINLRKLNEIETRRVIESGSSGV